MLLGLGSKKEKNKEQKKSPQQELHSTPSSRNQVFENDDYGDYCSENCKDVDIVSAVPECSISTTPDSSAIKMVGSHKTKEQSLFNTRIMSQDDSSLNCHSRIEGMSVFSSVFEFQNAERTPERVALASFSKPPPSKWDDAQKWIASPTSNWTRSSQLHGQGGVGSQKNSSFGYGSRQSSAKVVVEIPKHIKVPYEEPDTNAMDLSQENKETGGAKFVNWEVDPYLVADDSYSKSMLKIENYLGESEINMSRSDSTMSINSAMAFIKPPVTARSVSMRDMGTEMSPIGSQEPSRTGTPVRATTPTRSPTSSQSATPIGAASTSSHIHPPNKQSDLNKEELSAKELQMKTRREIMLLGTQLGKTNIAAWASKEEEDKDAFTSLNNVGVEQQEKSVVETCAAAWEEAEKAKCMARFKREEVKIKAWENHQKAKTEAEMRKIEVVVEKMRSQAHDKLMNKLAAVRHKAETGRAAAEYKRNRQAAITEKQVEYIHKTGRVTPSYSCCGWCF